MWTALHRQLVLRRRIGDQRARARLAARAGGGRHLHEGDAPAGHLLRPHDLVDGLAAAGQHGGELREVHGAAAAEADDQLGLGVFRQRRAASPGWGCPARA